MSYGLYDGDLQLYDYIPFFNLELMKIATYYKKKYEIVAFSKEFRPLHYQHFIVRQDYKSKQTASLFKYNNIEIGGRAFTGSYYQPLPLEIERMVPDTSLYDVIEKDFVDSKRKRHAFNVMRKSEHIRLSLDGKTIWNEYEKQFKNVTDYVGIIFHDYDLNKIEGSVELIEKILEGRRDFQNGKCIGMKFPVQMNNQQDLLRWSKIKPIDKFYSLQYNGIMEPGTPDKLYEVTKGTSSARQLYYNVTKGVDYEWFINEGIIELYRQVCQLRIHRVNVLLIYDDNFFIDRRWINVIKLIGYFLSNIKKTTKEEMAKLAKFDSMYNYVHSFPEHQIFEGYMNREDAREVFRFVRKHNYDLFKHFYEYRAQGG